MRDFVYALKDIELDSVIGRNGVVQGYVFPKQAIDKKARIKKKSLDPDYIEKNYKVVMLKEVKVFGVEEVEE